MSPKVIFWRQVQKLTRNSALQLTNVCGSAAITRFNSRYGFLNSEALYRPENILLHQANF